VPRGKGVDCDDPVLRAVITNNIGVVFCRLARVGRIRKMLTEPEVWWKLAE
jgi:hypothetical protein